MSNKFINPSGFAENLPPEQLVEESLKETFAQVAESYGYSRLETAAVEYMETLASKGEINKEIYTIKRALAENDEEKDERGLRFDLTVPFARYVAQNQGSLNFPFRRFQIQKVWRGERPQKGRSREFYQADIDVVAIENLSPFFDAEIALAAAKILSNFEIGTVTMTLNNRKFLNGILAENGIEMTPEVLQTIDKLDKIGADEVKKILIDEQGLNKESVDTVFTYLDKTVAANEVEEFLNGINGQNEDLIEGKEELQQLFTTLNLSEIKNVSFVLRPSIARGLDYYTGTVYETTIDGLEKYGSICSGGRYADLASRFTNRKLPGVGISIGLTRLLAIIKEENLKDFKKQTKTQITVCLIDEEQRLASYKLSEFLREAGFLVETNQKANIGLGKQLDVVEKKDIPAAIVAEKDGRYTLYEVGDDKSVYDNLDSLKDDLSKLLR